MPYWVSIAAIVTVVNLRTLPQRAAASAVAVVGVMGVVVVFVAVLSIAEGFRATMAATASPDTAIVLRGGSDTELSSSLPGDQVRIVAEAPGIVQRSGRALTSGELFVVMDVPKRSTGTATNVPLRGVQPAAFDIRDRFRLIEGRTFTPGRNEVVVGRGAVAEFDGLGLGARLRSGEETWTVVGIFEAGGSVAESEIWTDVGVLQPAYRRGNTFQSVTVKLESPGAFEAFKDALTSDPRLHVRVEREADYFAEQSEVLTVIITTIGYLIAGLMGLGAVFAAVNTMYSAVASRTREIATLRAIGFGGGAVAVSVVVESMLLALVGGALGGVVAYFGFHGLQTATLNFQTFTQVAFAFTVTPSLLTQGVGYALLLGLLGGVFPAVRAARLPVATALRSL